jgi:hypothetical protein
MEKRSHRVAVDAPMHRFGRGSKYVITDTRLAPYERKRQVSAGRVQRCAEPSTWGRAPSLFRNAYE